MIKMKGSSKKLFTDIFINSGSMLFYVVALQIIIYPLINKFLGIERFGQILTNMAVVNVGGLIIGSSVSNLLMKDFGAEDNKQDFSLGYQKYNNCYLYVSFILLPIICLAQHFFLVKDDILLTTLVLIVFSMKTYLVVEFRVDINYLKIALSRFLAVLGYMLGFWLYKLNVLYDPMLVMLLGELLSFAYVVFESKLIRSGFSLNIDKLLVRRFFGLFLSVFSNNSTSYGDRFILSKLIGFGSLPIFFSACVTGRMLQMCFNVVSNVLLSYLVNIQNRAIKSYALILILISVLIGFFSYIFLCFMSPHIIGFLYPDMLNDAMGILASVNLAFSAKMSEIFVRPVMLRTLNIRKIAYIDTSISFVYLLGGIFGAAYFGLEGFVVCFSLVSLSKLMLIYLVLLGEKPMMLSQDS